MNITQKPSPNQDGNRVTIDRIVIHWMNGTLASADAVFSNPGGTSAHYGIENNEVHQYVAENKVAYHAGNYYYNQRSIGIEHSADPSRPASEQTYQTSGQLVREIAKRYNIPLDRTHIIKHSEIVPTQCCGTVDIDKIINLAKGATPPMDDNIKRKSYFFDVIVQNTPRFGWSSTNTDLIKEDEVRKFYAWIESNVVRAGQWDLVCQDAKATGDTTLLKHGTIAEMLRKQGTVIGCTPAELAKSKEEGRKLGIQQGKDAINKLS